jgi:hypothetical protein
MERKKRLERPKAARQEPKNLLVTGDTFESIRELIADLDKRLKIVESGNVVSSSSVKKDYND